MIEKLSLIRICILFAWLCILCIVISDLVCVSAISKLFTFDISAYRKLARNYHPDVNKWVKFFSWFHILDCLFSDSFLSLVNPPPGCCKKKTLLLWSMVWLSQIMLIVLWVSFTSYFEHWLILLSLWIDFFVYYCFLIYYILNNAYFVTVICIYSNLLASKMTMFVQIQGGGVEDLSYKKCNSNWASFFKNIKSAEIKKNKLSQTQFC